MSRRLATGALVSLALHLLIVAVLAWSARGGRHAAARYPAGDAAPVMQAELLPRLAPLEARTASSRSTPAKVQSVVPRALATARDALPGPPAEPQAGLAAAPSDSAPAPASPSTPPAPEARSPATLDLSPGALATAARAASRQPPGTAEAAREQLGSAPRTAAERFSRSVASAALPDCLRATPDAEGESEKPTFGGLLAAPLIAYRAATGQCR